MNPRTDEGPEERAPVESKAEAQRTMAEILAGLKARTAAGRKLVVPPMFAGLPEPRRPIAARARTGKEQLARDAAAAATPPIKATAGEVAAVEDARAGRNRQLPREE